MVYFQTKIRNLGKFCRVFQWKMLVYLMSIWSIILPFGIFCCHLVYFETIWYILWPFSIFCDHLVYFSHFGKLYQKNLATLFITTLLSIPTRKQFLLLRFAAM
jgi:hypothetical protein